jgi:hypothetical protein
MNQQARVEFSVPLPPVSLRANSRAHWARKKKDADEYSLAVLGQFAPWSFYDPAQTWPWKAAKVHYLWQYCGVRPDHSNLGGHTKYLQDILCVAPNLSPQQAEKYKRWHMGIVENDSGICASYSLYKVKHRDQERVVVTIERQP